MATTTKRDDPARRRDPAPSKPPEDYHLTIPRSIRSDVREAIMERARELEERAAAARRSPHGVSHAMQARAHALRGLILDLT